MKIRRLALLLALTSGVAVTGCVGPAKVELVEEIEAHETAFLVPLETGGSNEQNKLDSVDYLEDRKLAKKRVTLGQREKKTGRHYWQYEWIPTEQVIKVSRKPVTREWTGNENTGTTSGNQAIVVQTSDKIKLLLGVTIQARIDEADTALFLYHHKDQLETVIDRNVRGWVQQYLAERFAKVTLDEAGTQFPEIFNEVYEQTKAEAAKQGITIVSLGNTDGFEYVNPEIKRAIDQTFTAKQNQKTAEAQAAEQKIRNEAERAQQEVRNEIARQKKAAEAAAAEAVIANKEALLFQLELDIRRMEAEAELVKAQRWNGGLPTVISGDGEGLFLDISPEVINKAR